ncbi:MAG: RNA 2',3'-cyclic phosphodiesterase [Candidatus Obscuribacterales bacterium]|nr:RNA 2',3'-cyclic phosphodiesterase [Candidatus Obscuribacterales bacterium]
MEKARLFVGTFLNAGQASLVEDLKKTNTQLSQRWQLRARFVPAQKLHLTWFFIGDAEADQIENIKADLQSAIDDWKSAKDNRTFPIQYDRLEVWSSLKSPRVLVFESTSKCPQAESLNSAITKALLKYTPKNDKVERFKRFRPHLTVCRFSPEANRRTSEKTKRTLGDFQLPADFFPLTHEIGSVSLIESDLNAGPNGYSSLFDIALD